MKWLDDLVNEYPFQAVGLLLTVVLLAGAYLRTCEWHVH